MITHRFDQGWGPQYAIKQFEQQLVDQYVSKCHLDTVLINSTWYSQDYHRQVMDALNGLKFDQIVLISMIDAAIPQKQWYQELGCVVREIGYYAGIDFIDFWALAVDKYFERPTFDCTDPLTIDTAYMCLNRKPHWHRKKFYNQLVELGIVEHGLVSLGNDHLLPAKALPVDAGHCVLAPNSGPEQYGIPNDIMSLGHTMNWKRIFLNVVTETQYDISKSYFVSEKIYKPILGMKPFLVVAHGADDWLSQRGFEIFSADFKDISDLDLSQPGNIAPFLACLCNQDSRYFQHKYLALKSKIMYNYTHFAEYVQQQKNIVKQGMSC